MTRILKEIAWRLMVSVVFLVSAVTILIIPQRTILAWHGVFDRVDRKIHETSRRRAMN